MFNYIIYFDKKSNSFKYCSANQEQDNVVASSITEGNADKIVRLFNNDLEYVKYYNNFKGE